jgi:hypothetical protein
VRFGPDIGFLHAVEQDQSGAWPIRLEADRRDKEREAVLEMGL